MNIEKYVIDTSNERDVNSDAYVPIIVSNNKTLLKETDRSDLSDILSQFSNQSNSEDDHLLEQSESHVSTVLERSAVDYLD